MKLPSFAKYAEVDVEKLVVYEQFVAGALDYNLFVRGSTYRQYYKSIVLGQK